MAEASTDLSSTGKPEPSEQPATEQSPQAEDKSSSSPPTETTSEATPATPVEPVMSNPVLTRNISAFVLGATGEVGRELVKQLAFNSNFDKITLIGRREVKHDEYIQNRTSQKVVDYDKLDEYKDVFQGHDVGYCCLGTTKGKSGAEGFKKVDHDYIMSAATIAKETGCKMFHLTSSKGADEKSRILYTRVKGQVDREVSELGFDHLFIYRPGVLMCDRQESRPVEAIFRALMKPIAYFAPTFISTPTEMVAKAMLNATLKCQESDEKVTLLENKALQKLAAEPTRED